jgi:predicted ATPase
MNNMLLNSLQLRGFLSFGPDSEPVKLTRLNVLIGPNGVGKSNFIEAVELLHATPTDFGGAIRLGGLPGDWIWHGERAAQTARIEATLNWQFRPMPELRYYIEFLDRDGRAEILFEVLKDTEESNPDPTRLQLYYQFQSGSATINVAQPLENGGMNRAYQRRILKPESIDSRQSVFSQIRDIELYPEVTAAGVGFNAIQIFREWSFGRSSPLRLPQPANLPSDSMLPQLLNLGLVLNDLEHRSEWSRFNELMARFLPRFKRISTKVAAGSVQVYLHEDGLGAPIPATRLSDGTLRFLTLLAVLLNPASAPLICIEEPELGLHPDTMEILASLLQEASQRTQLIITTHSDTLVSALTEDPESVLVCDYGRNGTEMTRLDPDKLKFWLEKYRLGEVWRLGKLGGNL